MTSPIARGAMRLALLSSVSRPLSSLGTDTITIGAHLQMDRILDSDSPICLNNSLKDVFHWKWVNWITSAFAQHSSNGDGSKAIFSTAPEVGD